MGKIGWSGWVPVCAGKLPALRGRLLAPAVSGLVDHVKGRDMALQERAASGHAVELPEPWRSSVVTVVLPTYNEAANLPVMVEQLLALPLTGLRILVADDNSPDGTGAVADQLAEKYGQDRVSVMHRPGKQGLGRAYVDGMTHAIEAGAEFVVQMDSDLSHSPLYLPQMLGTLLASEADVVIGSRYVVGASLAREWSWQRKALSGFANFYVRALLRLGVRDVTAGFKLWRSSALTAIDVASVRSNGYSFQVEMNYRAIKHGLKIVELPIHFADRREGESKMSLRVQLESALMPLSLRRKAR
jgi:dolichol-phosphate mannosyltransferase